jgi:hypothetical protein
LSFYLKLPSRQKEYNKPEKPTADTAAINIPSVPETIGRFFIVLLS